MSFNSTPSDRDRYRERRHWFSVCLRWRLRPKQSSSGAIIRHLCHQRPDISVSRVAAYSPRRVCRQTLSKQKQVLQLSYSLLVFATLSVTQRLPSRQARIGKRPSKPCVTPGSQRYAPEWGSDDGGTQGLMGEQPRTCLTVRQGKATSLRRRSSNTFPCGTDRPFRSGWVSEIRADAGGARRVRMR